MSDYYGIGERLAKLVEEKFYLTMTGAKSYTDPVAVRPGDKIVISMTPTSTTAAPGSTITFGKPGVGKSEGEARFSSEAIRMIAQNRVIRLGKKATKEAKAELARIDALVEMYESDPEDRFAYLASWDTHLRKESNTITLGIDENQPTATNAGLGFPSAKEIRRVRKLWDEPAYKVDPAKLKPY